jgi:hypothetical protein
MGFKSQIAVRKFICDELVKRGISDYTWDSIVTVKVGTGVRVFYAIEKSVKNFQLKPSLVYLKEKEVLEAVDWIEKEVNSLKS